MNKHEAKVVAADIVYKNTISPDQLPDDDYYVVLIERLFSSSSRKIGDKLFSDGDEEIGENFRHVP